MTAPLVSNPTSVGADLTPATLGTMYRKMLLCRALDLRAWTLSRQGRAFFVITGRGHEAGQVGCAFALQPGRDWVVPYYRDLGLALGLGMTPTSIFLSILARSSDPLSGGRQLPMHFSDAALRIVSGSSVVASQIPHAVGLALAARLEKEDVVAITFFGEGATSKGDFHEAINFAAVQKLPVIFFCENNGYAISLPGRKQMLVESVAAKAEGYGVPGLVVDGLDPVATFAAVREARRRALAGDGPILIDARVERLTPHSSDDDDRSYRSRDEVAAALARDPVPAFGRRLREDGILDAAADEALQESVTAEIDAALAAAEAAPQPDPRDLLRHVYEERC
jgi:2-oxoisovalerate dehydrogenase E1 component alpha subunit